VLCTIGAASWRRRFYFRPIDGQVIAAAGTMNDFRTAVRHLDPRALEYHLERARLLKPTCSEMRQASLRIAS